MFVVVALQDYYANGAEVPVLTYFEDNSFSYIYNTNSSLQYQPTTPLTTSPYYWPDIAVGYDMANNIFLCAVSCVQENSMYNYTVYQYEYNPNSPTAFSSYYNNTVTTFFPFTPDVVRPRICAPPFFNTSPSDQIPFALSFSNSGLGQPWSSANMLYAHYDPTNVNEFYPDGQNLYGFSYCGEPSVEYMQDSPGMMNREACVIWPAMIDNGVTIEYGIYSLMDPFINNVFYDWSQVNLTPITTANNVRFCTAIAGTWENAFDTYVVAWLTDSVLSLKYRPMHTTNYKLAQIVADELKIFPNPANSVLNLQLPSNSNFKIHSVFGNLVYTGQSGANGRVKMDIGYLSNGIYVCSVKDSHLIFQVKH